LSRRWTRPVRLDLGPPSIGKTNLLRYLDQERLTPNDPTAREPLRARTAQHGPIIVINVDPERAAARAASAQGISPARAWRAWSCCPPHDITPQLYPSTSRPRAGAGPGPVGRIARLQAHFESAHPVVTDLKTTSRSPSRAPP
jgi:hypothetical protein